jgi:O-antigen ligase
LSPNKYRDYFLKSFGIGVIVSVLLSCVSAWFNQPILEATPDDWSIFRTHTYHNFFAAIVGSGILAALLTDSVPKRIKPLLIFSISIISYDILFLVAGRTGQIIYVLMIIMVLFHWKWKQGIIFSLLIIATLAIILPQYSSAYIQGMNNARADLNAFSQGNPNTSIGLRLVWHKYSLELIKEKPWLGHGTGSFKGEYKRIIESKNNSPTTENPHNDYLWLSVDLGIFGGLLLIGLLLSAAWQGRHLKPAWRWTLHSLLLGMGISTLANSFFTDNISGLGFVLLTCALLNGPTKTIEINA